ncbi:ATP-grasp domain-containing protein [Rudaeicoccus suwonensis]|uniref:ATP-grasp domain-containing protein n=1 Tax=Rudaeicoccus suwonensis TaxID=657409 RepID=A0A561E0X0_9MICO|nr:hypothetical protein [Rudaeicoccus suwonensis]TWE09286.1 hypothetical protein BKA23_2986 [Rudaeicoccus suwonensis]
MSVVADTRLVILQSVQPLTTDVSTLARSLTVLTDGSPDQVARSDVPAPAHVVRRPRDEWRQYLTELDRDTAVTTNDEYLLAECARLRHHLSLRAVTPTPIAHYLDKVSMKSQLYAAGIRVPAWVPVDGPVSRGMPPPPSLEFPVVAKPRMGSNSRGVRVIDDAPQWQSWTADKAGQAGWQIEEHIDAAMFFVDAFVHDRTYTPVLVGRYLGPLLPSSTTHVLGAVSVDPHEEIWRRAVELGRRVADCLGTNGRFATHLEFFDTGDDLVALEVSARAPGAMVSEMARVVSGHNLETAHLAVQAGSPLPRFTDTGRHAAWISLLAARGQTLQDPPDSMRTTLTLHHLPPPRGTSAGRYIAALGLLVADDVDEVRLDVDRCTAHSWFH